MNHLKKKFTGTIGKLSDKITEEEELEASEAKSSEKIGESKNLNETDNLGSSDDTVEKPQNPLNALMLKIIINNFKIIRNH